MGVPLYCVLMTLLTTILVSLALPVSRHRRLVWLACSIGFFTLYSAALTAPSALPFLRVGSWNWSGKALAILTGLTPLLSAAESVFGNPISYDRQKLAFEASMPGLDEEFAYRGILFALLLRGFSTR